MSKENRVEKNGEMRIRGSRGTAERIAEKNTRIIRKRVNEWVRQAAEAASDINHSNNNNKKCTKKKKTRREEKNNLLPHEKALAARGEKNEMK